jgi:insertion element IS1 protein InsB
MNQEEIAVEICQVIDESELDEMWSFVGSKDNQRWLWHADHKSGVVLAYAFGARRDELFLQLKELLQPFGISRLLIQQEFINLICQQKTM